MKKKTRLIVQRGNENVALKVEDIALIYRDDNLVLAVDKEEKKYLCSDNLTAIQDELDPGVFFRVNRKYLLNMHFMKGFKSYDKVKLEVFLLLPSNEHQIIISQETAPLFKKWLLEERG